MGLLWWTPCWSPRQLTSPCSSACSLWMTAMLTEHQARLESPGLQPAPHSDQPSSLLSPHHPLPVLPPTLPRILLQCQQRILSVWRAHFALSRQRKSPQHHLVVHRVLTPSTASPAPLKSASETEQDSRIQMQMLKERRSRTAWLVGSVASWMSSERPLSFLWNTLSYSPTMVGHNIILCEIILCKLGLDRSDI